MKYLLVLLVVVVVGWLLFARRRSPGPGSRDSGDLRRADPAAMVPCAHCGVHLPAADAVHDGQGRPYCGEPHRVAGPR